MKKIIIISLIFQVSLLWADVKENSIKNVENVENVNPRKKYKKSIMLNLLAPSVIAVTGKYRVDPSFDISIHIGLLSGIGVSYHFLADSNSGSTPCLGADFTYVRFKGENIGVIYLYAGYQYISQDGFYFSTNFGYMKDNNDRAPHAVMGGLNFGYSY